MTYLYTFIMDYLGGTYISQVEAESNKEAIRIWIQTLKIKEIDKFSKRDRENVLNDDSIYENIAPIDGMINVWCIGITTKKGHGLVNFVKTDRH